MMSAKKYPVYAEMGNVIIVGLGAIGRATLPLLERHFKFDPTRLSIIDPRTTNFHICEGKKYNIMHLGLTPDNYRAKLDKLVQPGSFVINLSVDVSSAALMGYCRERGAKYLDTVVEPWKDGYDDHGAPCATRSNYVMREEVMELKKQLGAGPTAVTCCGANPGMVSWCVKDALLRIAEDTGVAMPATPKTRDEWALLMQACGVKGVHVAERDTQKTIKRRPDDVFVNTWSVEGFVAEGFYQPAELGWGTHEKWMPAVGHHHEGGCGAAIYLEQPGALTQVRSWCPTHKAHRAFLVTHNEAISISDYYTVGRGKKVPDFRPTCHYAYRMCDEALNCCNHLMSSGFVPPKKEVVVDDNIAPGGFDELGVLLYGHKKNAFWLGSKLTIEQAREIAPLQNPTAMQVSSAVIAGMVYAINHPNEGIIEADEMEHKQCLEVQRPYLGEIIGTYTDWTPLEDNFVEKMFKPLREGKKDPTDPWQFKNVLVH